MTTTRNWGPIVAEADRIARTYPTAVTLRQLHYRLVAASVGGYENTQGCYKQLSALTAEARRAGWFAELSDRTRGVERPPRWSSPAQIIDAVVNQYRRDHTEGQEYQTWVLYEKATLGAQIESWTRDYGIPTAALRGYSSESLEREIFKAMESDGRPVVVWYIGDLDPEGIDIERNFQEQADRMSIEFEHWDRLTVLSSQIGPLGLVPNPGKMTSSRASGFIAEHGSLFQIETEAVDPTVLEALVGDAITNTTYFDEDVLQELLAQEEADRQRLAELRDSA